ncbi:MAG: hypothetical protein MUO76_15840, partial [Anaerolineaceae bacterium]|nr:hypothetical protein [Anaerolineaceae bacterium]
MQQIQAKYYFDRENRFVIENYNWAKSFSNFLPGIAGKWGIPMWVYYVSKGQAVCSLGVHDKDHAIMEFQSFNKAFQTIFSQGFRTFVKCGSGDIYEPFRKVSSTSIKQQMLISSHELELCEVNEELGLEFNVLYFPLVNYPVSGLVRQLQIKNLGNRPCSVEVIDGTPRILPYGVKFEHVKVISHHIEAMMGVEFCSGIPLYRLKQTPSDTESVDEISGGNYYFSFDDSGKLLTKNMIVDPYIIFGESENYDYPWMFAHNNIIQVLEKKQILENRTPCGMTAYKMDLSENESHTINSLIGYVSNERNSTDLIERTTNKGGLEDFREDNFHLIESIKNTTFTASSEPVFDQYC